MTRQNKFSPYMQGIKERIKAARIASGMNMNVAAEALGISRKQLEDIETLRNYGSHVEIEMLAKMSILYNKRLSTLTALPQSDVSPLRARDEIFDRPRRSR